MYKVQLVISKKNFLFSRQIGLKWISRPPGRLLRPSSHRGNPSRHRHTQHADTAADSGSATQSEQSCHNATNASQPVGVRQPYVQSWNTTGNNGYVWNCNIIILRDLLIFLIKSNFRIYRDAIEALAINHGNLPFLEIHSHDFGFVWALLVRVPKMFVARSSGVSTVVNCQFIRYSYPMNPNKHETWFLWLTRIAVTYRFLPRACLRRSLGPCPGP